MTVPIAVNNAQTTFGAAHAIGETVLTMGSGYGATLAAKLTAQGVTLSAANPLRVTAIRRAFLNAFGQITDVTKLTIFNVTGRTGDTLTGATVVEGTADQAFTAGDSLVFLPTAGWANAVRVESDALGSLSDVGVTGPAAGQLLVYDGSEWVNTTGRVPGPVVNLLDPVYGVVAGDIGDQRAATQAAIDAAQAAGIPLYVPPGTYAVTGTLTLTSGTTLHGEPGLSKLHFTATAQGQHGILIDGNPTPVSNVRVRGLTLYSNNAAVSGNTVTSHGIYIDNHGSGDNTDIVIEDCEFYHLEMSGVNQNNVGSTTRLRISRCRFHDIGTATMNSGEVKKGLNPGPSVDCTIENCDFAAIGEGDSNLDHGIYASRPTDGLVVHGCSFDGCGLQVFSALSVNGTINQNIFRNVGGSSHAIILGGPCNRYSVTANVIEVTGDRQGIQVYGGSTAVTITGNTLYSRAAGASSPAIKIIQATTVKVEANTIDWHAGGDGVQLDTDLASGATSNVSIGGNIFDSDSAPAGHGVRVRPKDHAITNVSVIGNHVFGFSRPVLAELGGGSVTSISRVFVLSNYCRTGNNVIRLENVANSAIVGNYADACGMIDSSDGAIAFNVGQGFTAGTASDVSVRENHAGPNYGFGPVIAVTSGATPSLTFADSFTFTYGSATNVTGFTDFYPGEVKTVFFGNGNVTLKHSSTLKLRGATDVTPAADAVMAFGCSAAGVFREVSRNF